MKISTVLNVHGEAAIVSDTLDSIKTYMTEDILMLVDAAANKLPKTIPCVKHHQQCAVLVPSDPFGKVPVAQAEGLWHGKNKSPFRNITLGLKILSENWHGSDWYCYMEYDCLVASEDFKQDLDIAGRKGIWMIGNDLRNANYSVPLLEKIVGCRMPETSIMLGCCIFIHKYFMNVLRDNDFFTKFLHVTNGFQEMVPGFEEQGAYDYGEVMYPTLAKVYGGKLGEFAHWNGQGWGGKNWERYPMRFRPDVTGEYPDASIIHPLKTYDNPIRKFHREMRKRCKLQLR